MKSLTIKQAIHRAILKHKRQSDKEELKMKKSEQ